MQWGNKKPKAIQSEFAILLEKAEENKRNKKAKKKQQTENPTLFQGFIDNTTPPVIDYNFECGCFGTEHSVINNCLTCGRIICAREGERPCPYCGTPVFSDATLNDPDRLEALQEEMKERIGSQHFIPACQRDYVKSQESPTVPTQMIDLETDWFDSELVQIFGQEQ